MPEIFIPEQAPNAVDGLERAARELEELADRAAWELWLSTQSETIQALAAELETLRKGVRFSLAMSTDHRGRRLYVCTAPIGHHESRQSYEHALFLLVDSHRIRLEDRPETARLVRFIEGGDLKVSARRAQEMAKQIRKTNPGMPGERRDELLAAELDRLAEAKRSRP